MKARLLLAWLLLLALPVRAALLAPGDYRFELEFGGRARSYYVHLPSQAASATLPVMIWLHGGGGSARQFRRDADLDAAADRLGFIAVYPNGTGRLGERLLTWNAGNCCSYAMEQQVDDIGFISAMLDDWVRRFNFDSRRIYAAGHSNGGMMAHRLGSALSGRIAAVASMAGAAMPLAGDGRAVPVLHIHSVDDPRALYDGGLGPPFPMTNQRSRHVPVADMLAAWIKRDGCNTVPTEAESREADGHTAKLLIWQQCRDGAEVAHWKLTGAGHGWAGGKPALEAVVGPATRVVDATEEIWRFVSRYSLPR